jgi:iron-sulfur cluster assembly accessory protein
MSSNTNIDGGNINVNSLEYNTFNIGVDQEGHVVAVGKDQVTSVDGFYMIDIKSKQITDTIQVTDSAREKIKEIILSEIYSESDPLPLPVLRIVIRAGGCFGFSYDIGLGSGKDEDIYDDGFVVVDSTVVDGKSPALLAVDKGSYRFLQGCEIDFIDEIGGSFFKVNNPQAKGSCGCGNSFSV